jgi:hypothetical protein
MITLEVKRMWLAALRSGRFPVGYHKMVDVASKHDTRIVYDPLGVLGTICGYEPRELFLMVNSKTPLPLLSHESYGIVLSDDACDLIGITYSTQLRVRQIHLQSINDQSFDQAIRYISRNVKGKR